MSSPTQCPTNCHPESGKLIPIPLGCGEVEIMQPAYCEQIYFPSSELGFCDLVLLPDTDDPIGIIANLPVLLLFTISAPARFLYCSLLYNALITADFFTALQQAINTDLDLILNPIFSLIQGFVNGDNGAPFEPNSVDNRAVIPQTCIFQITPIADFINLIDEGFYTIGYALGYVFYLIKLLYDTILEVICFIAYFGLQICVGVELIGCACTPCIQPFGFLQKIVNQFINCSCLASSFCYTYSITIGNIQCGSNSVTCGNKGQSPSESSGSEPSSEGGSESGSEGGSEYGSEYTSEYMSTTISKYDYEDSNMYTYTSESS